MHQTDEPSSLLIEGHREHAAQYDPLRITSDQVEADRRASADRRANDDRRRQAADLRTR